MSGGYLGMDPDLVATVGTRLQRQSEALQQVLGNVDRLTSQAESVWGGRDSDEFVHAWRYRHRAAVANVQEAVAGLGRSAIRQAEEQRGVSSVGGVGSRAQAPSPTEPALLGMLSDFVGAVGTAVDAVGLVATVSAQSILGMSSIRAAQKFLVAPGDWLRYGWHTQKLNARYIPLAGYADEFARWSRISKVLGPIGLALGTVSSGLEQWQADAAKPWLSDWERGGRAAAVGVGSTAVGVGVGVGVGVALGAVLGPTVVGAPVAVIAGAAAGAAASSVTSWAMGQAFDAIDRDPPWRGDGVAQQVPRQMTGIFLPSLRFWSRAV